MTEQYYQSPMSGTPDFTPVPYTPAEPQAKETLPLTKRDTVFAIGGVVVCVFSAVFGIFSGFSLGYALSVVLTGVWMIAYFLHRGQVTLWAVVSGLLSLALSAIFVCTTNGSVRFFGVVVGFLLSLCCYDGLVSGPIRGNRHTLGSWLAAVSTVGRIGLAMRSLFSREDNKSRTFGKVLIGLACALPVLLVVLPLLLSSDYAFQGMMENLFEDAFATMMKSVFGVGLSLFAVTYGLAMKHGHRARLRESRFGGIANAYVLSFLCSIAVFYLLYLFSQLAYFFNAFKGFLPSGDITFAQYARKGFFEMSVIAAINLVLVFAALILAKKTNGKVSHSVKAVTTFIALFTLIIIATALSKMVLYIDTYGMTVLRLTTSAFMVFLAVVFVGVILRIYLRRVNVAKLALITAACVLLVLGVGNVNGICARYNYEAYKSGTLEEIDIVALYELGDDGIPYLVELAYAGDTKVSNPAKAYLARAYLQDYFEDLRHEDTFTVEQLKTRREYSGFARYSIPREKAYDSLYAFIEENPWFAEECQDYLEDSYAYDDYL